MVFCRPDHHVKEAVPLSQGFSITVIPPIQRMFGNVWGHFCLSDLDIVLIVVRDATHHPMVHRAIFHSLATDAKAEKQAYVGCLQALHWRYLDQFTKAGF